MTSFSWSLDSNLAQQHESYGWLLCHQNVFPHRLFDLAQ